MRCGKYQPSLCSQHRRRTESRATCHARVPTLPVHSRSGSPPPCSGCPHHSGSARLAKSPPSRLLPPCFLRELGSLRTPSGMWSLQRSSPRRRGRLEHRVMRFQSLHVRGVLGDHPLEEIEDLVRPLRLCSDRIQECAGGRGLKLGGLGPDGEGLWQVPTETDGRQDLFRTRLLHDRELNAATVAVRLVAVPLEKCVRASREIAIFRLGGLPYASLLRQDPGISPRMGSSPGTPFLPDGWTSNQRVMRECLSVAGQERDRIYLKFDQRDRTYQADVPTGERRGRAE